MGFSTFSDTMDKYISPLANKLSQQRHLKATRDAFMSMLPITLFGSIPIILNAPPVTEDTKNGFVSLGKLRRKEQSGFKLDQRGNPECYGLIHLCRGNLLLVSSL